MTNEPSPMEHYQGILDTREALNKQNQMIELTERELAELITVSDRDNFLPLSWNSRGISLDTGKASSAILTRLKYLRGE